MQYWQEKDWLYEHYVRQNMGCPAIAKMVGLKVYQDVVYWLKKHDIPLRPAGWHMQGSSNRCLGKALSKQTKEKIASSLTGHKRSEASIKKQVATGKANGSYSRKLVHPGPFWITCDEGTIKCMRSSWEVAFAERLSALGYTWVYERQTFSLGDCNYTPDFYVKELDSYFEVKGWLRADAEEKITKFKVQYPQYKLVLADKKYLLEFGCDLSVRPRIDRPAAICQQCGASFIPKKRCQKLCSQRCTIERMHSAPRGEEWKKKLSIA